MTCRAIEVGCDLPRSPALSIEDPQLALVVERARRVVSVIRDRFAVRRVERMLVGQSAARREVPQPPRLDVDDDDVARIHQRRLRGRIDRQRELAPVGRDVVVLGRRIPWLQRDARASQQVLATSGRDVAREDMRLATVGQPVVPEPVFAALGQVSLDLRLLFLRDALRLRSLVGKIRPHPGHERDALAVGEPLERGDAGREVREPNRFAAVGRDQIDLRLGIVAALRGERDLRSVGRPARVAVLVAPRQAARLRRRGAARSVAGGEQPQLRASHVALERERRDRRACEPSVGRDRRRADAPNRPERVDVERRFAAKS